VLNSIVVTETSFLLIIVRENFLIKIQTGARLNFWYANIKHIVGREVYF